MSPAAKEVRLAQRIAGALPGAAPGVCLRVFVRGKVVMDVQVGETYRYYDLASLTKIVFTQQALMRAFDQGRWSLDSPVTAFLPDFPRPDLKLTALLCHSSGITWWKPFYQDIALASPWADKRAWLYQALKESAFEQTERAVYSDLGYMLLGFALEAINNKSLLQCWNDLKADCYAASDLAFHQDNQTDVAREQFAPTENCAWRKKLLQGEVHDDNAWALGGISSHAGLFGSLDDLSAYGLLLRAQYLGAAQAQCAAVSKTTARLFARRALAALRGDWALGYMLPTPGGASCGQYFGPASIGHTGFTGTSMWFDSQRDLLVLMLSNRVLYGRDNKAFILLRPQIHDWIVELLAA